MGSIGTNVDGTASFSKDRSYCPPGDTTATCSPVGEWSLDEKSGTSAFDKSGDNHTGTLNNSPAWLNTTSCKIGNCVSFNGSNQFIDVGNGLSTVRTIEFWVYPETTTEFLANLTSTTDYIWIDDGTITAAGLASPTIYVNGSQTSTIAADTWSHVVITTATAENASNLNFGRTQDANYLEGRLDHIKLYDYVLNQSQVAWQYNRGGPIGWWKLNEFSWNGTAGEVKDSSENGLHGVRSGNATTSTGKYNNAGIFDGNDDYVSVADSSLLDFGSDNNFSVSFWANINADTNNDTFVGKINNEGDSSDGGWRVRYTESSGHIMAEVTSDTLNNYCTVEGNSSNIEDGNWHHITVVFNRNATCTTNDIVIYIDGKVEPATSLYGGSSNYNVTNNDPLTIGAFNSNGTYTNDTNGLIDDLRIYNYALSPTQIKTILNNNAAIQFAQ